MDAEGSENGNLLAVGRPGTDDVLAISVVIDTVVNIGIVLAVSVLPHGSAVLLSGILGECDDAISGVGVRGFDMVEQLDDRGLQLLPLKTQKKYNS